MFISYCLQYHFNIFLQNIKGLADYDQFYQEAESELDKVHGHLVMFPEIFLRESLSPSYLDFFFMYVDSRGIRPMPNMEEEQTFWV